MPADPCADGVVALAAAIRAKQASPVAVMAACLERIDALDPKLKAFVSIYPDQAMAAAQSTELAILAGRAVGPLAGMPVAAKDLFKVEGMRRTGGSIRIPASLCGVVGAKQTYGLASRHGIFPVSARLDHGGPSTRSAADTALILQAIAGSDPADPSTRHAPILDYSRGLGSGLAGLAGLRIGVPRGFFFDQLHPEVDRVMAEALSVFDDHGAVMIDIDLPFAEPASEVWTILALAEAYAVHERSLADHGAAYSPDVRARLELGRDLTARDVIRADRQATEINRQMAAIMAKVDLLVTPTTPIPAPFIETGSLDYDGQVIDGHQALGRFTRLAALTGQPALSLPAGFSADGLPIGLQLIGDWFRDDRLLAAAAGFEAATPWARRRPPDPS